MKFRPKFKPNLSQEGGQRNRGRTAAEAGLSSPSRAPTETLRKPPAVRRVSDGPPVAAPALASPTRGLIRPLASPPTSPVAGRRGRRASSPLRGQSPVKADRRRTTEAAEAAVPVVGQPASVFHRRKADHKRKFTGGVPERGRMTMFDLIYYNPHHGSRMSTSSSRRTSRASSGSAEDALVPEAAVPEEVAGSATPTPEEAPPELEEDMPVPQVKVGADGQIILDDESTLIETSAAKKAKQDLLKSPLVFEHANQATNYGSWGKKRKNVDWGDKETIRFYKALSIFGTDFSMMENLFKKRSRHELKMKFKKEERVNRPLVDKCLREGMQFDTSVLDSESEEDEKAKKVLTARKRSSTKATGPKRRVRKERTHRGYYSSSEDAADASDEDSLASPTPRRPRYPPRRGSGDTVRASPLLQSLLAKSDHGPPNAFPPGLLAANPDLASAVPGSLVVVGSPADHPGPSEQGAMVDVYRVAESDPNPPHGPSQGDDAQS